MFECQFCGLESATLSEVFGVEVCADCVELAEIAYEPEGAEL